MRASIKSRRCRCCYLHARGYRAQASLGPGPKLTEDEEWLRPIPGAPPSLINLPTGCAFHPRCFLSQGRLRCREEVPPLRSVDAGPEHKTACHFAEELAGHRSKFSTPVAAGEPA